MPAWTLSETPSTIKRFDALTSPGNMPDCPTHLMLCIEPDARADVTTASEIRVAQMFPPFRINFRVPCRHAASIDLDREQSDRVATFVSDRDRETKELELSRRRSGAKMNRAQQYRIHPPFTPPRERTRYWRFSCVGFVLAAYADAGIRLVGTPESLVSLEDLKLHYPNPELDDPNWRVRMGLDSSTMRWPVVFAGHVLHAMNREPEEIHGDAAFEFIAKDGDEYFPRRETAEPDN